MREAAGPGRWQQIDDVFAAALDRPPAERRAWLEATYAGDAGLISAVLELLASAEAAAAVLGESVSGFARTLVADVEAELAAEEIAALPGGGRVGPWRLLREIGRGGMGTVYLAQRADDEYDRQVALKLVKRGMDTDEVLLRFHWERRILASLEHPWIARLYDAGAAEDGRPYLVMEYVAGRPITQYCEEERLTIDERLRLFARVCEAVQFAHRSFVIHRDIKPSNILVDATGTPRLLDFGIARLLDPDAGPAVRTRTELRILTPEYASPEQHAGQPVTTAADVYSLGTVLYELLTGTRPPSGDRPDRPSAVVAAASDVAERRRTTPARLQRRLRGDLDTIVLRALAPEVEHRYASAEQLFADLERHLGGQPVLARPQSLRYRAAKFVRRHRVPVAAAAVVLLSLTGGLGAAVSQAERAARERDQARAERARAEEVSTFLLSLFEAANPMSEAGGADTLRVRTMLDRAAERAQHELAAQPRLRSQMLTTLGRAFVSLGLYPPARSLLEEAVATAQPDSLARERAIALAGLGDIAYWGGDHARSDSLHLQVAMLYERSGWGPDETYIGSMSRRANALEVLGRPAEALPLHLRAVDLIRSLGLQGSIYHGEALNNLGVHYWNLGQYEQAEPAFREALAMQRTVYGADHPALTGTLNNLAVTLDNLRRNDEAEELYVEALRIGRQAYGDDHVHVGQFLENLAIARGNRGARAEADLLYREALRIRSAALGSDNPRVAMLKRNMAGNLREMGDHAGAVVLLREAVATFRREYGPQHLYTAIAELSLGGTLNQVGGTHESLPLLRSVVATFEAVAPEGHEFRTHAARVQLGVALAATGRTAEGEGMMRAGYSALLKTRGPDDVNTRLARDALFRFYSERGQPERAAQYRHRPDSTQVAGGG